VISDVERRAADELSNGGRILLSRLQYLGDVILTLPAVRAIRDRFPRAEIDYLSRGAGAEVLKGEPLFSRVFRAPEKEEGIAAQLRLIAALRGRRYAAAVDWYSNPRSALFAWLSGAKLRVGGSRRIRRRLYTHPLAAPPSVRSAIDHHLYYLRPLGIDGGAARPALHPTEEESARAARALAECGAGSDGGTRVAIHPGGKWEVKRWPAESYAALARRLTEKRGFRVVVLAGPGEDAYREALRSELGDGVSYVPTLPIRDTVAVLAALDAAVVNDGGIMHASIAVGTPTVGIFGSSEPDIWFPYASFGPFVPAFEPIECRPCHLHECGHLSCLRRLAPETVEARLVEALDAARARSRGR
jgi:ADP-heptose:LPS heptosyltransferase